MEGSHMPTSAGTFELLPLETADSLQLTTVPQNTVKDKTGFLSLSTAGIKYQIILSCGSFPVSCRICTTQYNSMCSAMFDSLQPHGL